MTRYQIECTNCGATRLIEIHPTAMGQRIDWLEDKFNPGETFIISARERLDGNWGFQCTCGADDLMTKQEKKNFSNPQAPSPKEIGEVVSNLKVQRPLFNLVVI